MLKRLLRILGFPAQEDKAQEAQWEKSVFNSGDIKYIHTDKKYLLFISKGSKQITIDFVWPVTHNNLLAKYFQHYNNETNGFFLASTLHNFKLLPTSNIKKISRFLDILEVVCPLNHDIKSEVDQCIKILSNNYNENICKLLIKGNLLVAKIMAVEAQQNGFFEPAWILAESFYAHGNHSDENVNFAFGLYQDIIEASPYYCEAHKRLTEITLSVTPPADKSILLLEHAFRFSLKADLPTITDQLYYTLCGGTGMTPDIRGVKGDADTLIASAKKTRLLANYKSRHELKKYNKSLFRMWSCTEGCGHHASSAENAAWDQVKVKNDTVAALTNKPW